MSSNLPKFIVVVAGVPPVLSRAFKGQTALLEEGRRKIIWLPMNNNDGYDPNYIKQIYNNFYSELRPLFYDIDKATIASASFQGAMTVYLTHQNGRSLVEEAFSVETLTVGIPMPEGFSCDRQSRSKLNRAANAIAGRLKRTVRKAEKVLSAVSNQVVSRDNRTPLLLPERSFDAAEVRRLAESVGKVALRDADAFEAVTQITKSFEARNPRTKGPNDRKSFKNAKNVLFQGPGSNRHALAHLPSKGHRKQCLVRGRIRLGAIYDPKFHYDCVSLKGGLAALWKSCHEQDFSLPRGRGHVNISPNDHVR